MFNNKRRIDSAFAKGLMFGKAVGKRDERDRIIDLLEAHQCTATDSEVIECWCGSFNEAVALIKGKQK